DRPGRQPVRVGQHRREARVADHRPCDSLRLSDLRDRLGLRPRRLTLRQLRFGSLPCARRATQDQPNQFGNNGYLVRFTPAGAMDAQFYIGGGQEAFVGGVAVAPGDTAYAAFDMSLLRFPPGSSSPEVAFNVLLRPAALATDPAGTLYTYD